MKSIYTFILLSLFIFQNAEAQLPYKSLAPDFTAKDINDVEHNLYDLLDDGKIVILDIFATWCGPCWSYHNQHILADLYDEYGPNGKDEIYVFAIEGDASTSVSCITGPTNCNSSTFGNWTTGIPYPIIDDAQISKDYGLTYYPTLFMIYPNKKVVEIGQKNKAGILEFVSQADPLISGLNPIVLYSKNENGSVCFSQYPSRPHFLISNMGTENVTSMDFEVTQDGELIFEESWTGDANPYEIIAELSLPLKIVSQNTVYELTMKNINGNADHTVVYDSYLTLKADNLIYVDITTDANAGTDNNRFDILDKNGDLVASESINKPNQNYKFTYVLENKGCHTFSLYDNGENGIEGQLSIKDSQGNSIYNKKDFGAKDVQKFNVSILSSNDEFENSEITVSPNPVNDKLYIDSDIQIENVQLIDATGKIVLNEALLRSNALDVSFLQNGLYIIKISTGNDTFTKKIMKF